ncbi:MAG TPA: CopD family protein [Acidobacteriaceae bacterium]|nr:CopD family protein [Acidobacteriaceae bacterium]
MLWFLRDYPLAAVVLRAATLAFEALLIGGFTFCVGVLPCRFPTAHCFARRALRLLQISAAGLAVSQIGFVALDSEMLIHSGLQHWAGLISANYFLSGALLVLTSTAILLGSWNSLPRKLPWLLLVAPLLAATVWTSHAASRLEDRTWLILLTGLHQLAAAVWMGALPYLWLLLNAPRDMPEADWNMSKRCVVRRYSAMALTCVLVLIVAGVVMAWFYTQTWNGVYGTAYGVVLTTKTVLLLGLLLIGAGNYFLVRGGSLHLQPVLLRVARFSEVEIGIGFTIILAAASLTSQPPAVDLPQNRLTLPEIVARMAPRWPRFRTPSIHALPPVQPIHQAMRIYASSAEEAPPTNNPVEQQWSEYNHHWAGIIVFAAGLLAILGRWKHAKWAQNWPLAFLGLAIFLFLRADPEAWPLGPRGFWASFYNPEDLEHRLYVLLIVSFVAFEWSVQTQRLQSAKAALVFPAVCALGGALLLTHNHTLGNVKEDLLAEMSHTAIAILAVFAGWSRWLDLRGSGRAQHLAARVWPVCLMLIGLVLLNYRES